MARMISEQQGRLPTRCRGVWSKQVVRMLRNEYSSIFTKWSGSEEASQ